MMQRSIGRMKIALILALPLFCAPCRLIAQATVVTPQPTPVPTEPSAMGVNEVNRLSDTLSQATRDVGFLQARIRDWPGVSFYASENAALQAPGQRRRVVFLGDSITRNWASLKNSTFFHRTDLDLEVVNRGIGGQTVAQMVLRLRSDVVALQPGAMVLLAGTNDIPSTRVPNLKQFIEDSFSDIFDIAEKNHIPVVVCSILPVSDAYGDRTTSRPPQTILELNDWLREESRRRGLAYVDFYSVLQDGHDRLRANLTTDGLHPNAEGYALMEPIILKALHDTESKER